MSRISDAAVTVLAALILVSFAACGGPASSPSGPDTLGAGSAEPKVILSQLLDNVEQGGQRVVNVNVPFISTLEVTLRWNDPANSVSATLMGVGCPNFRDVAADCQERRSFPRGGREFREGVITYRGAGGAYHLVVENAGPGVESIAVTVALISAPTPLPPSPYPHPTPYPTNHPPH